MIIPFAVDISTIQVVNQEGRIGFMDMASMNYPFSDPQSIHFDDRGLVPAIIQDHHTGQVLMLGHMNSTSLQLTLESGLVTFWSRSRQATWTKGTTSGNFLHVVRVLIDCNRDAVLILVRADGPTCHTGEISCFSWELNMSAGRA